jgi:hypothetical protein
MEFGIILYSYSLHKMCIPLDFRQDPPIQDMGEGPWCWFQSAGWKRAEASGIT